jgi:hypothetical protein
MPIANKLKVFDFDKTVSKNHTFNNRSLQPQTNIKTGLPLSHVDGDDISAIATYHDDPAYVASYIACHLGKKLSLKEILAIGEHQILSVYDVIGQETPFVISTLPAAHFQAHLSFQQDTGKNNQLEAVRDYLIKKGHINASTNIDFYDDSENNTYHAANTLKKFPVTVHAVEGSNPDFKTAAPVTNSAILKNATNPSRFYVQPTSTDKEPARCCGLSFSFTPKQ